MKKTKKNNKPKKRSSSVIFEQTRHYHRLQPDIVTDKFLEIVSNNLLEWARNDKDALILSEFYVELGVSGQTIRAWKKRNPSFAKAVTLAKMAISVRRQKGMLRKELAERPVWRSLPLYSESWKDGEDYKKLHEWEASVKTEEEEKKATTYVINMPDFKKKEDSGE